MFQPIRKINLIGIDLHCVPIACFRQCIVAITCQRMDRVGRQQLCLLQLLFIQIDRIYRRPILKDPDFIRILCCLLPENLRRTIRTIMIDSYQLINPSIHESMHISKKSSQFLQRNNPDTPTGRSRVNVSASTT